MLLRPFLFYHSPCTQRLSDQQVNTRFASFPCYHNSRKSRASTTLARVRIMKYATKELSAAAHVRFVHALHQFFHGIFFFYIPLQIQIDELEVIIILCLLIRSCFRALPLPSQDFSTDLFPHLRHSFCSLAGLSGAAVRFLRRSFRSYRFTVCTAGRRVCAAGCLLRGAFFHFLIGSVSVRAAGLAAGLLSGAFAVIPDFCAVCFPDFLFFRPSS